MFGSAQRFVRKSGSVSRSAVRFPKVLVIVLLITLLTGCVSAGTPPAPALQGKSAAVQQQATLPAATAVIPVASSTPVSPTLAASPTLRVSTSPPAIAAATKASGPVTSPVTFALDGTPSPFNPPVVGRGGKCVAGYVIDKYHKPRGAGWEVILTAKDASLGGPWKTIVKPDGSFMLPPDRVKGEYTVELKYSDSWQPFTPALLQIELDGKSSDCADLRFKMEALACLKVIKQDENGNVGLPGKVGIPGWKMTLSMDGKSLAGVTDGIGEAYFRKLAPGVWRVKEEVKLGWIPADGQPAEKTIELESPIEPGDCETLNFLNQQLHTSCILVKKIDTQGNALSNWNMTLVRKDGTRQDVTKPTNLSGQVLFQNLPLGEWTIIEGVKPWYRPVGGASKTINLPLPSTKCEDVVFTNEPLGCIDGYKINDLEQGLPDWKIEAVHKTTGETASAISGGDGYFKLEKLGLGVWTVREIFEPDHLGWTPVTDSEFDVTVDTPFTCEHVRFKNRAPSACIDVYKKDAYDGAGLPDWPITVKPTYGDSGTLQTQFTSGDGWVRFANLPPGEYTVSESMLKGWVAVSKPTVRITAEASGSCYMVTFYNRQENLLITTAVPPTPVPPAATPVPTKTTTNNSGLTCSSHYTVVPGDTIYRIALRFGVSQTRLSEVNKITNPSALRVGTVLCIP